MILLVSSKCARVVEAKLCVYKKYENIKSSPIIIHHAFDDEEDLLKLFSVENLRSLDTIVKSTQNSVPLNELKGIVEDAANKVMKYENILRLCNEVCLMDGTTTVGASSSFKYPCSFSLNVTRLKNQLMKETLDQVTKSFASEMCQGILRHIKSKVEETLQRELDFSKISLSDDLRENVFVLIVEVFKIYIYSYLRDAAITVITLPIILLWPVDVNCKEWRVKVAKEIYNTVKERKPAVIENVFKKTLIMCEEAVQDLRLVSEKINDIKERICFPDQKTRKYFNSSFL